MWARTSRRCRLPLSSSKVTLFSWGQYQQRDSPESYQLPTFLAAEGMIASIQNGESEWHIMASITACPLHWIQSLYIIHSRNSSSQVLVGLFPWGNSETNYSSLLLLLVWGLQLVFIVSLFFSLFLFPAPMVLLSKWLIWWASDTMLFSGCGCSIYCQNWAKKYPITSTSAPTESRVAGTRSINTTSGSLWVMVSRAQGHSYFLPSVAFQNHVLCLLRT